MNVISNTTPAPAVQSADAPVAAAETVLDPALDMLAPQALFAQWLDQAGQALSQAPAEVDDATPGAPVDGDAGEDTSAAPADESLLAALAMPLAPTTAAPVMASIALDASQRAAAGTDGLRVLAGSAPPVRLAGATQEAARPAVQAPVAGPALPGEMATVPTPAPSAPPAMIASAAAESGASAAATAPAAAPAPALAVAKAEGLASPDKADASAPAASWNVAAPATPAQRPAAPVALAGPPTAWRQSLHEALGERLRVSVGAGIEQAVIRLDPPNLGRVEIAIRHSAGALEVSLSATHSEVVRQLHSVSDNLRNDLAGRQYTEVAVTVSQAARPAQAGLAASADGQGRGGQDGRKQDEAAVGTALADAGGPASTFTLNGRE